MSNWRSSLFAFLTIILPTFISHSASAQIYVNSNASGLGNGSSWENAFTDLQLAISASQPGEEIWVAAGTYKPDSSTGNREATFRLKSGVALYGGFSGAETKLTQRDPAINETFLSGDLNGDDGSYAWNYYTGYSNISDNSKHVITAISTNAQTILDGFTVIGGNAEGTVDGGGGLYISSGNPVIRNCKFTYNRARGADNGGGAILNINANPTISSTLFYRNKSYYREPGPSGGYVGRSIAGAIYNSNSSPQIQDCVFLQNKGDGGGVFNIGGSSPIISSSTFEENAGNGAIANYSSSNPVITNSRFIGNSGRNWDESTTFSISGAAIYNHSSSPQIINSSFEGNTASDGGAIYNYAGSPSIKGCIFSRNQANGWGGAMQNVYGTYPTIENSIFHNNLARYGGAIYNTSGVTTIINSVIANNMATGVSITLGGGIYNASSGAAIIWNSILWGNQDDNGSIESSQITLGLAVSIKHTIIQGLTGTLNGSPNYGSDPLFVDAEHDNFQVALGSPAIDAGAPLIAPRTDIIGTARPYGAGVDLGAYELIYDLPPTATPTATVTPTPTRTATPSITATATITHTATASPTNTATPTMTATPSNTSTPIIPIPTATSTPTPTMTSTVTATPTSTGTAVPTVIQTIEPSPTETPLPEDPCSEGQCCQCIEKDITEIKDQIGTSIQKMSKFISRLGKVAISRAASKGARNKIKMVVRLTSKDAASQQTLLRQLPDRMLECKRPIEQPHTFLSEYQSIAVAGERMMQLSKKLSRMAYRVVPARIKSVGKFDKLNQQLRGSLLEIPFTSQSCQDI